MPATIDTCLSVADALDFQVQLHTDTLNEPGFYERTMEAIAGHTIYMYHTEGAGGGHAPDIIRCNGEAHCLPSSTNPTNPYTSNTFDEHLDMTMAAHVLRADIPEDVAHAEGRIRRQSISAEDVLHDIGAISMMGSDSQGMSRVNEVATRTWQLAAKMKDQRGRFSEETTARGDNERIKRYIAKYTINAARTFGIAEHVGSIEPGKMADLVIWAPSNFGIKAAAVYKKGFIAWAGLGDGAACLSSCEPILHRPQWGAFGSAAAAIGANFVHPLALEANVAERLGLTKPLLALSGTRSLGKSDMLHNDACPDINGGPADLRRVRRRGACRLRAGREAVFDPEVPAALTANGHPKGADECEPAPLSSARSLMHFPVYPVRFTVLARADSGHPGMTMGAGKLRARGNPSK